MDEKLVTRIEIIDETGRVYVKYGVEVELSYQDDGRTLKVFVRSMGADAEKRARSEMADGLVEFMMARKAKCPAGTTTVATTSHGLSL